MADKRITDLTEDNTQVKHTTYIETDHATNGSKRSTLHGAVGTGWGYYQDSTYTSGSPLVANNAKVQMSIDGLGANTEITQLPNGVTNLWDVATNKIIPKSIGDSYAIRVDLSASPTTASDWLDFIIDIGTGAPDIPVVTRTLTFAKTGTTNFSIGVPIFSMSTFVTNGGKLYLDTSVSADNVSIFDMAITIIRTHVHDV
jgi:hypothetical protein